MTKADLVERIQTVASLPKKDSIEMLEAVLSIMKTTLEAGEPLKISGFGVFSLTDKADRNGRNPQSGEAITITARRVLKFKASTKLKDAINRRPACLKK